MQNVIEENSNGADIFLIVFKFKYLPLDYTQVRYVLLISHGHGRFPP